MLSKKVELSANISIILVSLILGFVLLQKYIFVSSSSPRKISVGTKVQLSEEIWNQNGKTLLLVLQKGCHYCTESAAFYKQLSGVAKEKNIKLIAVLPSPVEESKKYLQELGVIVEDIQQATPISLNVRGTPTLILANERGEIINFWIGRLSPEHESKVISEL